MDGKAIPMEKSNPERLLQRGDSTRRRAPIALRSKAGTAALRSSKTPTAFLPSSPNSICICTAKARSTKPGKPGARISPRSKASRASVSPSGRPNAESVSVTGDFNEWDTRRHPMRRRNAGVWEIFIPGAKEGDSYKYFVRSRFLGHQQLKADPYGFRSEVPPKSASIVCDLDSYDWHDAEWMQARGERQWLKEPVSIYEVHLESWMRKPSRRVAELSRTGGQAGRVRQADGLHAHRIAAHSGVSRFPAPGAIRSPAISRPPRASARRRTSCSSSIPATPPASA